MASDKIPCPVCGKMFKPCMTSFRSAFFWRATVCSPECRDIYIERAMKARKKQNEEAAK